MIKETAYELGERLDKLIFQSSQDDGTKLKLDLFESSVSECEIDSDNSIKSYDDPFVSCLIKTECECNTQLNQVKLALENSFKYYGKIIKTAHKVIRPHYLCLIKVQLPSRMLQSALNGTCNSIINDIHNRIKSSYDHLLTNRYSNYFCQRLFERVNQTKRVELLKKIFENIVEIACSPIGTFSVQKIFEMIKADDQCFHFIRQEFDKISLSDLHILFKVNQLM